MKEKMKTSVWDGCRRVPAGILIIWLISTGCGRELRAQQTLEFSMRQGQPYPWNSTAYPVDQRIRVSAGAGWKATVTGELLNACGQTCFSVKPKPDSDPGDAVVSFLGLGSENLPPGVHTAVLTIGAQRWNIRLTVNRRQPYLPVFYRSGYPQGCRNSHPQMLQEDTCDIADEQPAKSLEGLRKPGDVWTDPQFGSPVHRVTPSGYPMEYSTVRVFSANAKYMLAGDSEGFLVVWDREKSRPVGDRFSTSGLAQTVWDPNIEERIWFVKDGKIGNRNVVTGALTIAADYSRPSGARPSLAALDTGGTADNTDDNWWVFTDGKQSMVCALDLNDLKPANQEEHLFCASYAKLGLRLVDFPQVTQVDRESGKRYVLILSEPRAHVFSVNTEAKNLAYEFEMPSEIITPHSDVSQDDEGRQVLFWNWYDPYGNKTFVASAQLNKREKMTRPVEEGGGLSLLYSVYGGAFWSDYHFGCNWSGDCVTSGYVVSTPGGIPNWTVADVKSGSSCVVQLASDHPFRTGMEVAVGGVGEMSGVNGVGRVRVIDSRTLELDRSCSGKYQRKTGHVAEAKQWTPAAPNRDEIVFFHLGGEVRRIAAHRSKIWAEHGNLNTYWAAPEAGISRDGRYIGISSNLGLPEQNSLLWAEVDLSGEIRKVEIRPGEKGATVHWDGPEDVTIRVSPYADMSRLAFNHKYPAGEGQRERAIDGLSPDTVYYYQLSGANSARQGTFRTLKAQR